MSFEWLARLARAVVVLAVVSASACGPEGIIEGSPDDVEALFPEDNDLAQEISSSNLNGTNMADKTLSLTFDDGPGPRTYELAKYLADNKIRATFFVLGARTGSYPWTMEKVKALGHLVANHTYTHPRLSATNVVSEMSQCDTAIAPYAARREYLFRAPGGSWSSTFATTVNATSMRKYVGPIYWNIGGALTSTYAADWACWSNGLSVSTCYSRYLNEIAARRHGIVLMHDIHSNTIDMVKKLVPELKARGYKFLRLDEVPAVRDSIVATNSCRPFNMACTASSQCCSAVCSAGKCL